MVLIMITRPITGIIMPIMDWVVSNPSVCEDFLLYILNIKCYFKNFAASKFYVGKPKTSILSKHATTLSYMWSVMLEQLQTGSMNVFSLQ